MYEKTADETGYGMGRLPTGRPKLLPEPGLSHVHRVDKRLTLSLLQGRKSNTVYPAKG
jgi:hypothetical protein